MTDVPQASPNGLMHIGAVAAHNIAAALELPQEKVGVIEQAIKDEINAMSSHFSLAMRDVQDQYELDVLKVTREKDDFIAAAKALETQFVSAFKAEVADIKSTFNYVSANGTKLILIAFGLVLLGAAIGHFV